MLLQFCLVTITLTSGKWKHTVHGETTKLPPSFAGKFVIDKSSVLCFIPNPNFNGMTALSVAPAFTKVTDGAVFAFGSQTVTIKFNITAVNDRPVINKGQLQAPPLAYNLSSVSTAGFMVSTLLDQVISTNSDKKVVTDPDQDAIGITPYGNSEAYLESSQTSTMERFCKNS